MGLIFNFGAVTVKSDVCFVVEWRKISSTGMNVFTCVKSRWAFAASDLWASSQKYRMFQHVCSDHEYLSSLVQYCSYVGHSLGSQNYGIHWMTLLITTQLTYRHTSYVNFLFGVITTVALLLFSHICLTLLQIKHGVHYLEHSGISLNMGNSGNRRGILCNIREKL